MHLYCRGIVYFMGWKQGLESWGGHELPLEVEPWRESYIQNNFLYVRINWLCFDLVFLLHSTVPLQTCS